MDEVPVLLAVAVEELEEPKVVFRFCFGNEIDCLGSPEVEAEPGTVPPRNGEDDDIP